MSERVEQIQVFDLYGQLAGACEDVGKQRSNEDFRQYGTRVVERFKPIIESYIKYVTDALREERVREIDLHNTMDASVWADEFNAVLVKRGETPCDRGWLISWFSNAIMAGHDSAQRQAEARVAALRETLAFVEWVERSDGNGSYCPWCGNDRKESHDQDCTRQQALEAHYGRD